MQYCGLKVAKRMLIGLTALLAPALVNAAALTLSPTYPDLTTFNATYDYVIKTNGPASGKGGTFTVDGSLMSLNVDGNGSIQVTGSTDYTLIANFDLSGNFIDGDISITGTTTDANFSGTNLLSGDILDFGFSGTGQAGSFEFTFDNLIGDFAAYGAEAGTIISTTDFSIGFPNYSGSWDPLNDGNTAFWTQEFSGTAEINTFALNPVPVPAAAWLFGSGLIALFSTARSKKRNQI